MGDTVEAISTDTILFVELVGKPVEVGVRRYLLVKTGIENCHLGYAWYKLDSFFYAH